MEQVNNYNKKSTYKFIKLLNDKNIFYLKSKLKNFDGIDFFDISNDEIEIEYSTLKLSEKGIFELFIQLGYPLELIKQVKYNLFKRFMNDLAKSNKESFGSKKLDCCDLKH